MKIREIEIKSLFGYFDHKIPLKQDDRITIIHGPNGVGKTTILRLVSDLFKRQFLSLLVTPFDRIVIRFSPKGSLTVVRTKDAKPKESDSAKLELIYRSGQESTKHVVSSLAMRKVLRGYPSRLLESTIDNIDRVGPDEWYDEKTGRKLSFIEVVRSYGDLLPAGIGGSAIPVPPKIENILDHTHIVYVEAQRLFTKDNEEVDGRLTRYGRKLLVQQRMTVEQYSEDMVTRIKEHQRKSGELGASLDSTFPRRLLELKLPETATKEHIGKEYRSQSDYRDRLMKAGLIVSETAMPIHPEGLEDSERKLLWAYLDDVKTKLQVFNWLLPRVELFKSIVNSRFSYKQFKVDKEKGFIFESDHDGSIVPPGALSSGEQHEIVLTYELLFRASAGSLIFIDEPELSLHVTWQRRFLEDIASIAELAELDFLVATHSPSIINDRRDLMVRLANETKD